MTSVDLKGARIAVVTTSLDAVTNDIWHTTRPQVAALAVVGASPAGTAELAADEVGLAEVDLGRGLVWRHLRRLNSFLSWFAPDLIHVNGELWGITAQELLHRRESVVVHGAENLWEHGGAVERQLRRRLVDRAVRRIAGYASWNHAGAEHVHALRLHHDGTDLPTLVVPGIVPPEPFRTVVWEPPTSRDDVTTVRVLLVGRMVPAKGFDTVIEAAALLPTASVRISLCGEGESLRDLVDLAAARGITLEVLGTLSPPDLAARMRSSHLMVQPSKTTDDWAEQFGRSVAEALVVGLPVVVSDSGELPHLVGHDPRAVFAEGDPRRLAGLLAPLAADRSGLVTLSSHQKALGDRYRPAATAPAVLDFWARSLR